MYVKKHIRSTPGIHSPQREQLEEPRPILLGRFVRQSACCTHDLVGRHAHQVVGQVQDVHLIGRLRREHEEVVLADCIAQIPVGHLLFDGVERGKIRQHVGILFPFVIGAFSCRWPPNAASKCACIRS